MFLASQLTDVSSRFSTHVEDLREFLLKERLPVPSAEAIPQLASRIGTDLRFRADLASLMRAILYEEREGIGYEDLLAILVTAAAGAEHDLKSDSEEADIRELLRFLLQSRRPTFRSEAEEAPAVEPEPRETAPSPPVQAASEPVLRPRGRQAVTHSRKLELMSEPEPAPAPVVAARETREPDDRVLPPFRTSGLFAAQTEAADPWWRVHSAWIVGVVCLALGVGLGLTFRQVVSAAQKHVAMHAAKTPAAASVAPPESRTGTAKRPSQGPSQVVSERLDAEANPAGKPARKPAQAGAPDSAGLGGANAGGPGMPVTVVKQVVTAPDDPQEDTADPTAATRSIVPRGSAGVMPANVIFSPAPDYPAEAAAARVHGQVMVRAVVDPEGNVIYAHAVSGPSVLRDAAQEAVHRWRYRPLMYNGKPIAVTTVAILDFKVAK